MDALAAWQLKKKKELEEKNAAQTVTESARKTTFEEEKKLNKLFGFPDPPPKCFSLGKEGAAAVWWTYEEMDGIIGWEVYRYRKDGKVWQNKGCVQFETLSPLQVIVPDLKNGHDYRFTVKAINAKGPGLESPPSNSVYVDSPLPPGWYRFYDRKADRHYFASLKTNRSSWTRPDEDPNFLGDDVFKRFKRNEIEYLRKLFDEDMEHFQCIKADQVGEIIREVGERLTEKKIAYFFSMISGDATKLDNWQQFVQFMVALKEEKNRRTISVSPFQWIWRCFRRQQLKADLRSSRNKLGPWIIEYNGLLQKHFYRNTQTGVTSWLMPDEVKFFLPKPLETKLYRIFDPGQIEDMKTYFALLDIDNSGDLSQKEISLLLDAMGIRIDDKDLENLIKTIDINGNGTVEFDEFCWMMFELARKDNSIVSKQVQRNMITGMFSSSPTKGGSALDGENAGFDKDKGLTFSALKRAVSVLRHEKELDDDDGSFVTFGQGNSPLKRAFSSFRGSVTSNSQANDAASTSPSKASGGLMSLFRSNKINDDQSVGSKSSKSKSTKKLPNPDLYKPKPKKVKRRAAKSQATKNVQEDLEDDYSDDYDDEEEEYAFARQKSGSFFAFTKGQSQRSLGNHEDFHEKDCMCGCRRF